MKKRVISKNMGSWSSSIQPQLRELADPAERTRRARNIRAGLKAEAQSVVDWARAAGLETREELAASPLVRQTLLAFNQASREYAASQSRSARARRRRPNRRARRHAIAA